MASSSSSAAAASNSAPSPYTIINEEEEEEEENPSDLVLVIDLSLYTWQEKLSWLNGADLWSLHPIPAPPADITSSIGSWNRYAYENNNNNNNHRPTVLKSIRLSDGPHGVRKPLNDLSLQTSFPATCFPSACAAACSWNVHMVAQMGHALSLECEHFNIQCLLGPGVNIKRHPTGGRNHEYYSEDPYLTGRMARAYINGLQQSGQVAACIKHYCVNNQESHRMVVNVVVDERTLRELYLPAFEMAIVGSDVVVAESESSQQQQQQPKLIMSAYNRVMGDYAGENSRLLQTILREEWQFKGVVVSDWGAVSDRVQGIQAGLDLEMPGNRGAWHPQVKEALEVGHLVEADIDACVERIVRFIQDHQPVEAAAETAAGEGPVALPMGHHHDDVETAIAGTHATTTYPFTTPMFERHNQLARELASECIVLLQNDNDFLPLSKSKTKKVGLIGDFAKTFPRYQGMGSAHVTPTRVTSVFDALTSLLGDDTVDFAPGYDANSDDTDLHQPLIDEAVKIAKHQTESKDDGHPVFVFVGLPEIMESEGFDRPHLRLPQQHIALVDAVCAVNANVVIVLVNGGVVEIPNSFVEGAKAIVEGFLLGQAGGGAMVDVLFGQVSPSGKLPETIPLDSKDIPAHAHFPGTLDSVEYREGLSVGYRYFNTVHVPVRFPFGHGLHYSTIDYANLHVVVAKDTENTKLVKISCDVRNVGTQFSVKEVVQVYIRPLESAVYRPLHELKQFDKVELAPGETKQVTFELNERAFAFYDIGIHKWIVEASKSGFEVQIGASSRDIRLRETIVFQKGEEPSQLARASYPSVPLRRDSVSQEPEDEVFARRFGAQEQAVLDLIESGRALSRSNRSIHRNTLLKNASTVSWLAALIFRFALHVPSAEVKTGPFRERELRMIRANVENLPLRGVVLFSRGNLTFQLLDILILLMNGLYWEALKRNFFRPKGEEGSSRAHERDHVV